MTSKHAAIPLCQRGIRKTCDAVGRSVDFVASQLNDPQKKGGYFCLLDLRTGAILITTIIGSINPEKALRYKQLAEEKALRLYQFYRLGDLHVSSWQSKNEQEDKWPGAVLGGRFIYSFSGFPWVYDEVVMVAAARKLGDMSQDMAKDIIRLSASQALTASEFKVREAVLQMAV